MGTETNEKRIQQRQKSMIEDYYNSIDKYNKHLEESIQKNTEKKELFKSCLDDNDVFSELLHDVPYFMTLIFLAYRDKTLLSEIPIEDFKSIRLIPDYFSRGFFDNISEHKFIVKALSFSNRKSDDFVIKIIHDWIDEYEWLEGRKSDSLFELLDGYDSFIDSVLLPELKIIDKKLSTTSIIKTEVSYVDDIEYTILDLAEWFYPLFIIPMLEDKERRDLIENLAIRTKFDWDLS